MGHLMSNVKQIEDLMLHQLPTKPIVIVKAVRAGSTSFMLGKDGKVYTSCKQLAARACFTPGDWRWQGDLFKAMLALGIFTKEHVAEHQKLVDKCELDRARRDAKTSLAHIGRKFGIRFTESQLKKIAT